MGFFVSTFVFWPKADVPYELPKVWFVMRWIEVLGVASFFWINGLKWQKIDKGLILVVLTFLSIAVMSSVFGVDFGKSMVGNYYRADGLITLFHFLILFFIVTPFFEKSWIAYFLTVVSFAATSLSFISVVQWLGNTTDIWNISTWDGGYGHVFGNPNFLVGYLIVTLPITAYFGDTLGKWGNLGKLGLVLQIIGIILTNAWVGWFGILLFLGVWLSVRLKKLRWLILLGGLVLIGWLGILFGNYQKTLETPTSINPESRERIFMKSILALRERPMLGYGWANFDKAFQSVDYPIHMESDVYVDKAHSSLLEVLVTTGITGFAVYLLIILKSAINLFYQKELVCKYILCAYLLLILHMQTNVISISEEILFWIVVGISAKLDPETSSG